MNQNPNAKTSQNQSERILGHLKSGRTLTALQALEMFQCFRLSARILELRNAGHPITREMITTPSKKQVAAYRLTP